VIVISARQHPGEHNASFIMEGLIRALLTSPDLQTLLLISDVHIAPMMNPDGVICGNSRSNLSGLDINRRWAESELNDKLTPESAALKYHMSHNLNGKVLMFIDIHGQSSSNGMVFYSNDSNIKQQQDTIAQLGKRIEAWLQMRLLPKVLQKS